VDGYPDSTASSLQVLASKSTRRDLVMNVPAAPPSASPALAAAVPAPSPEVAAAIKSMTPASSLGAKLKSAALAALTPAAAASQSVPEALTSPDATEGVDNFTPFAFGD